VILYKSLSGDVVGRRLFVQQGSVKWVFFATSQKREMAPNTRTALMEDHGKA
jgi:hypothetical protein